jgi:hypothetical protein
MKPLRILGQSVLQMTLLFFFMRVLSWGFFASAVLSGLIAVVFGLWLDSQRRTNL